MYSEYTYDDYERDCESNEIVLRSAERWADEMLAMMDNFSIADALNEDLQFVENRKKAIITL